MFSVPSLWVTSKTKPYNSLNKVRLLFSCSIYWTFIHVLCLFIRSFLLLFHISFHPLLTFPLFLWVAKCLFSKLLVLSFVLCLLLLLSSLFSNQYFLALPCLPSGHILFSIMFKPFIGVSFFIIHKMCSYHPILLFTNLSPDLAIFKFSVFFYSCCICHFLFILLYFLKESISSAFSVLISLFVHAHVSVLYVNVDLY